MHELMAAIAAALLLGASDAPAAPTFDSYPAIETMVGAPAQVDLGSHPRARRYRTYLRTAATGDADFAGHYALVRIGCGTSCIEIAVVDLARGTVFFPPGLQLVQWAGWWNHPAGPEYQRSSRLLVVHGVANEEETEGRYGISYFLWNGHDFKLLRFDPKDRGRQP